MTETPRSANPESGGVRFFPSAKRPFEPYRGFANAYPGGEAAIARLVGPADSATIGCGVVRYRRVRTVWELPIDEIVHVLEGSLTVISDEHRFEARRGDVFFFPRGRRIEYDVADEVTLFYAEYPASGPLSGAGEALGPLLPADA